MIVKTNSLEYILIAILSIIIEEKKIHLVIFHFYTFKTAKFNYDMHNKKLVVLKAFYI